MDYTYSDVAKMIDHSLLQPTLTDEQLDDVVAYLATLD